MYEYSHIHTIHKQTQHTHRERQRDRHNHRDSQRDTYTEIKKKKPPVGKAAKMIPSNYTLAIGDKT